MKINVSLPFDRVDLADEFGTPQAVAEMSALIDRLRFEACCVSDHPCPTGRWLDAGGHHAQDPFVLLSLIAAQTKRIKLQTGIVVLPYRNPFITARMVSTLDVFSSGRVILGVGAGYLKGEYRALGVDFDQRNKLMNEYILALKQAWTKEEFTFEGGGYVALGNRILPRPVQKPHPPILIGGNSKLAIRRAAELGDAWNPFFSGNAASTTTRTASITGAAEIAEGVAYMHEHCVTIGRKEPPEVITASLTSPGEEWNPEAILEKIGQLKDAGVSGAAAHVQGETRAEWMDNAERFDADVLSYLSEPGA